MFGCVTYAHVPDELRKKLESKAEKCIFLGYNDGSKSYKLYNPLTNKVIIGRDVQFIEEEAWDGSLEKTINVKTCISHEDKEELIAEIKSSMVAPPPPIQAQQRTLQASNRTTLINQGSASPTTPQGSTTPSSSSVTPSTSSANTRIPRFRNLSDIYEQEEVENNAGLNYLFALFFMLMTQSILNMQSKKRNGLKQ